MALVSTTTRIPLAKSLLPVSTTLDSAGLDDLIPLREMLPPGDTIIIPLNWKLRLPLARFVIFITLNQLAQKGVAVLAGMIDIDCPGKIATKRWKYERLSGTQKTPQDILQFYHIL